jgi:hypothetical protein
MKLFIFLILVSACRPQFSDQKIQVSEKIILDTDMGGRLRVKITITKHL